MRERRDRYRTELTDAAVLDAVGPCAGWKVLDAGCGEGYLARSLASRGAEVIGVDVSRANPTRRTSSSSATPGGATPSRPRSSSS
ncbi:MAG: class I SAM-dependent methyltransferase [Actinoallomurus sp.]